LTDYVNVLVAQTQLLHAQQNLATVEAEQLSAHASLIEALGGGIDDPSNGPKNETLMPAKHIGPLSKLQKLNQPRAE
jgi:hypothetical protein